MTHAMTDPNSATTVLIYGGGVAGALLARGLSDVVPVTLVDPLDYFEVPMAAPRNLVQPAFAERAIMPFAEALPTVRHLQGRLTELSPTGGLVALSSGRETMLRGQITVLATGSQYANDLMRGTAGTGDTRRRFYERYAQRVAQSRNIVIVGGGPIGVELAGEILESAPGRKLTLVEAGPRILAGTTPEAAGHVSRFLVSRGVEILLDQTVVDGGSDPGDPLAGAGTAVTSVGRRIPYDLMVWCTGGRPGTGYMRRHFSSVLNERGRIRVTPELTVLGHPRLYALGDINDVDENKMAWHIAGQVDTTRANILRALKDPAAGPGRPYRPQTNNPSMAVTLGSKAGVLYLQGVGLVTWGWFVSLVKSRHMLVPKYRKALGLK